MAQGNLFDYNSPELIAAEGVVTRLSRSSYQPKRIIELIVIRIVFGEGDAIEKTFWWLARDDTTKEDIEAGRLLVTSMRDAVAAARHKSKKEYKIARTLEESHEEPEQTLAQWSRAGQDLLSEEARRNLSQPFIASEQLALF